MKLSACLRLGQLCEGEAAGREHPQHEVAGRVGRERGRDDGVVAGPQLQPRRHLAVVDVGARRGVLVVVHEVALRHPLARTVHLRREEGSVDGL